MEILCEIFESDLRWLALAFALLCILPPWERNLVDLIAMAGCFFVYLLAELIVSMPLTHNFAAIISSLLLGTFSLAAFLGRVIKSLWVCLRKKGP